MTSWRPVWNYFWDKTSNLWNCINLYRALLHLYGYLVNRSTFALSWFKCTFCWESWIIVLIVSNKRSLIWMLESKIISWFHSYILLINKYFMKTHYCKELLMKLWGPNTHLCISPYLCSRISHYNLTWSKCVLFP